MDRLRYILIYLAILLWFFEGYLRTFTGNVAKMITEGVLILCGICAVFYHKPLSRTGWKLMLPLNGLVLWVIFSSVMLHFPVFSGLQSYRYLIWASGFTLLVFSGDFSEKQAHNLALLIFCLLGLQIVISGIKLLSGHQEEYIVGSICNTGGGLATVFTLVIFGYLLGMGLFVHKIYLYLSPLAFLMGLASGKRAIFMFFPLFFIGLISLLYCKFRKKKDCLGKLKEGLKHFCLIILVFLPFFSSLLFMVKFEIADINLDNEDKIEYLGYVLSNYFNGDGAEYNNEYGESGSRFQNLLRGVEYACSDSPTFFFGVAPGTFKVLEDNVYMARLGMFYGIVGLIDGLLSCGVPFCLLILVFYYRMFQVCSKVDISRLPPFWQAYWVGCCGCFLTFLIIHVAYCNSFEDSQLVLCLMILNTKLLESVSGVNKESTASKTEQSACGVVYE